MIRRLRSAVGRIFVAELVLLLDSAERAQLGHGLRQEPGTADDREVAGQSGVGRPGGWRESQSLDQDASDRIAAGGQDRIGH